jgi:hypothetical protein
MLFQKEEKREQQEKQFNLKDPLSDATTALENLYTTYNIVNGSMLTSFTNIASQLEGIASNYNKIMGGLDVYGERAKQNIIDAKIQSEKFGFTLTDVANLSEKITGFEKTSTLLRAEQSKELLVTGELTRAMGQSAAEAGVKNYETFKNLGFTSQGVVENIKKVLDTSLGTGVVAGEVMKEISSNTAKLNMYNFDNGVQGMSKMATEAIMVKANIKDTLAIAEKLFDPQQAVEMAAGLQRMGVQITGLLDPISLMNMAENDPEALQSNLIELSKQFVEFDEKQKRFKVMPGAQRQIREVAKTLGIGAEEFAKMGMNALDLDRKLSQIKFPDASEFANEDTRKLIANMSQFNDKTGKYEIEVYDEKLGDNVTKAIDSLEPADLDMMKEAQKAGQKTSEQLLWQANKSLTNIANVANLIAGRPAFAAASSKIGGQISKFAEGTILPATLAADEAIFGKGGTKKLRGEFDLLNDALTDLIDKVKKKEKTIDEASADFGSLIKGELKERSEQMSKFGDIYAGKQKEAFTQNPSLENNLQLSKENVLSVIKFLENTISGIQLQDGLIDSQGGLLISGPKGSYFTDKDDKVLASPNIPTNPENITTPINSTVTAAGKVEIEHKFSGVEGWFKDYMLSQGFLADFVPTLEKFLTKTEG